MRKFIKTNWIGTAIIIIVAVALLNRILGDVVDPEVVQEIVRYLVIVGILVGAGYVLFRFIRK